MTTWQLAAVAGGILLVLSGCQTDPEITRLERENFYKQRQIEHLRWRVEDLQDSLESRGGPCDQPAWQAAGSTPRTLSQSGPRLGPAGDGTPSTVTPRTLSPPGPVTPSTRTPPATESDNGAVVKPPRVVLPGEPLPPGQVPETLRPRSDQGGSIRPADNSRVAQITLGESHAIYNRPNGSEAITVLVEPRDLAGNLLAAPGDVSIVLLDAGAAEGAAPLARWDFRAAQTAGMLQSSPGGGIRLDLPWREGATDHAARGAPLRLLVRYTTRDGRKLQTEQPLDLAAAGRKDSWRATNGNAPGPSEPDGPRTATRPMDGPLQRPVWSPDRPY